MQIYAVSSHVPQEESQLAKMKLLFLLPALLSVSWDLRADFLFDLQLFFGVLVFVYECSVSVVPVDGGCLQGHFVVEESSGRVAT